MKRISPHWQSAVVAWYDPGKQTNSINREEEREREREREREKQDIWVYSNSRAPRGRALKVLGIVGQWSQPEWSHHHWESHPDLMTHPQGVGLLWERGCGGRHTSHSQVRPVSLIRFGQVKWMVIQCYYCQLMDMTASTAALRLQLLPVASRVDCLKGSWR